MKNRLYLTNKAVQKDTIRFERTQIPFFSDVFTALVIVVACTDNLAVATNSLLYAERYFQFCE